MSYLVEIKGVSFSFKLRVDTTLDQLRQNLNLYMLIIAFDTDNTEKKKKQWNKHSVNPITTQPIDRLINSLANQSIRPSQPMHVSPHFQPLLPFHPSIPALSIHLTVVQFAIHPSIYSPTLVMPGLFPIRLPLQHLCLVLIRCMCSFLELWTN